MTPQTIAAYAGALAAIAFGAALLWFPPASLGGQAGTVGAAFAFVTGGFAGLGVTVSVPVVKAAALTQARSEVRAERARTFSPPQKPL
ncbi:MAG: hypothetical protein M3003_15180 [Candidatus Dormibacteraeota bacterium]|nr:hypothetical protein [Candidatus Dormibacteraeota bacterium]